MYDKKNFPPPHTKKNPPKNKIAPNNNVVKKEKEYEKKIQNNQRKFWSSVFFDFKNGNERNESKTKNKNHRIMKLFFVSPKHFVSHLAYKNPMLNIRKMSILSKKY